MQTLSTKKALITGAGTGIGREVALEFARQGADVVLHYAHSCDGAEAAVTACQDAGVQAAACQADLGQPDACFALVDWAVATLGGLDILVNNAGITEKGNFLEASPTQFDRLYQVNVRGQFFCAQQAVRHMLPRGRGALINLASIHAFGGIPGHAIYAGTKGAICAWTRELAIELAPHNPCQRRGTGMDRRTAPIPEPGLRSRARENTGAQWTRGDPAGRGEGVCLSGLG